MDESHQERPDRPLGQRPEASPDAAEPDELVATFGRFVVRWETYRAQLASLLGLNGNDVLALVILMLGGPMPVSRLRTELSFSSGATTLLVDRLTRYGLVERAPHPRDGRSVVIRLAPHHDRTLQEARRWLAAPLRALGPIRRGALVAGLDSLTRAITEASTRLAAERSPESQRPSPVRRGRADRRGPGPRPADGPPSPRP